MSSLLQPIKLGDTLPLRNRICMAPMTRNRNTDAGKPTPASVLYYSQRASAGLIVSEGLMVAPHASSFEHAPLLYNQSHISAWKNVVSAVHSKGGLIFGQSWHPGRAQNENIPWAPEGHEVLAPSKVKANGGKYRLAGGRTMPNTGNVTPIPDPKVLVEAHRKTTELAKEAGFDGMEVLCLGGYLVHSFLNSRSNIRTDSYGGSVENRCRFPLEVLDATISVYGSRRVGIKMDPFDCLNDSATTYEEGVETYTYLINEVMKREIAYICLSRRLTDAYANDTRPAEFPLPLGTDVVKQFGPMIKQEGSKTLFMINDAYTPEEAGELIKTGKADLVSLGRSYITNPDLVERVERGIPLGENDRGGTVPYGPFKEPGENYTDWPTWRESYAVNGKAK